MRQQYTESHPRGKTAATTDWDAVAIAMALKKWTYDANQCGTRWKNLNTSMKGIIANETSTAFHSSGAKSWKAMTSQECKAANIPVKLSETLRRDLEPFFLGNRDVRGDLLMDSGVYAMDPPLPQPAPQQLPAALPPSTSVDSQQQAPPPPPQQQLPAALPPPTFVDAQQQAPLPPPPPQQQQQQLPAALPPPTSVDSQQQAPLLPPPPPQQQQQQLPATAGAQANVVVNPQQGGLANPLPPNNGAPVNPPLANGGATMRNMGTLANGAGLDSLHDDLKGKKRKDTSSADDKMTRVMKKIDLSSKAQLEAQQDNVDKMINHSKEMAGLDRRNKAEENRALLDGFGTTMATLFEPRLAENSSSHNMNQAFMLMMQQGQQQQQQYQLQMQREDARLKLQLEEQRKLQQQQAEREQRRHEQTMMQMQLAMQAFTAVVGGPLRTVVGQVQQQVFPQPNNTTADSPDEKSCQKGAAAGTQAAKPAVAAEQQALPGVAIVQPTAEGVDCGDEEGFISLDDEIQIRATPTTSINNNTTCRQ